MKDILNKNKEIEFRYLDDETFILSLEKGRFYKLNNVGTDIWRLINGKNNVEAIINTLSEKYDVKKEDLKKDVIVFINKGLKHNIIEKYNKKIK